MRIQVTLFDKSNRYKPVSTLIKVDTVKEFNNNKSEYTKKAIQNICCQRRWTTKDLQKYGFTTMKCRVYNK